MIARIWSGESPLWLLLLPLSWLYGLVSGIIRLLYRLGIKGLACASAGCGCGQSYGGRQR